MIESDSCQISRPVIPPSHSVIIEPMRQKLPTVETYTFGDFQRDLLKANSKKEAIRVYDKLASSIAAFNNCPIELWNKRVDWKK